MAQLWTFVHFPFGEMLQSQLDIKLIAHFTSAVWGQTTVCSSLQPSFESVVQLELKAPMGLTKGYSNDQSVALSLILHMIQDSIWLRVLLPFWKGLPNIHLRSELVITMEKCKQSVAKSCCWSYQHCPAQAVALARLEVHSPNRHFHHLFSSVVHITCSWHPRPAPHWGVPWSSLAIHRRPVTRSTISCWCCLTELKNWRPVLKPKVGSQVTKLDLPEMTQTFLHRFQRPFEVCAWRPLKVDHKLTSSGEDFCLLTRHFGVVKYN